MDAFRYGKSAYALARVDDGVYKSVAPSRRARVVTLKHLLNAARVQRQLPADLWNVMIASRCRDAAVSVLVKYLGVCDPDQARSTFAVSDPTQTVQQLVHSLPPVRRGQCSYTPQDVYATYVRIDNAAVACEHWYSSPEATLLRLGRAPIATSESLTDVRDCAILDLVCARATLQLAVTLQE